MKTARANRYGTGSSTHRQPRSWSSFAADSWVTVKARPATASARPLTFAVLTMLVPGSEGVTVVDIEVVLGFALAQAGDEYIENVRVAAGKTDPHAFDCAELIEWACSRADVVPKMVDGSWLQARFCNEQKTMIPVDVGLKTRGALLFKFGSDPFTTMPEKRHVAISLGNDKTMEAQGSATGVDIFDHAAQRDWTHAALIPGVSYGTDDSEEDEVSILMFLKGPDGQSHPYVVAGVVGKHVSSQKALDLHRNLQRLAAAKDPTKVTILGEGNPLGQEWQDAIALMDGPLRNVP